MSPRGDNLPTLRGLTNTWTLQLPVEATDSFEVRKCIRLVYELAAEKGLTTPTALAYILRRYFGLPDVDIALWKWNRHHKRQEDLRKVVTKYREKFVKKAKKTMAMAINLKRQEEGKAPLEPLFLPKGAKEYDPQLKNVEIKTPLK